MDTCTHACTHSPPPRAYHLHYHSSAPALLSRSCHPLQSDPSKALSFVSKLSDFGECCSPRPPGAEHVSSTRRGATLGCMLRKLSTVAQETRRLSCSSLEALPTVEEGGLRSRQGCQGESPCVPWDH